MQGKLRACIRKLKVSQKPHQYSTRPVFLTFLNVDSSPTIRLLQRKISTLPTPKRTADQTTFPLASNTAAGPSTLNLAAARILRLSPRPNLRLSVKISSTPRTILPLSRSGSNGTLKLLGTLLAHVPWRPGKAILSSSMECLMTG